MLKVLYVYRTARINIFKNIKKGIEPDHQLYGLNYLLKHGYDVEYSDIAYSRFNIFFWICLPIQYLLIKVTSIGFKLDQALLLIPKIRKSDVILTTVDSAGLPILLLKKIKIINKPVIYISTGLINELNTRKKGFIYKLYSELLTQADAIISHSIIEKDLYNKLIPRVKLKTIFIPFGIDVSFFKGKKENGDYILSVGRDRSRDFKLLSQIAEKMPDEKFIIITSKSNIIGINFPSNVKIYFDLPYIKVKEFYLKSRLVFLPLLEINRASGQISFLESLATGKNVVVAKVKGILEVYPELVKKSNVKLYKINNLNDAIAEIQKTINSQENIETLNGKYSSKYYNKIIKEIVNQNVQK